MKKGAYSYKSHWGLAMSKVQKSKKEKVPKITEEEYASYIAALKDENKESLPPPKTDGANGERI